MEDSGTKFTTFGKSLMSHPSSLRRSFLAKSLTPVDKQALTEYATRPMESSILPSSVSKSFDPSPENVTVQKQLQLHSTAPQGDMKFDYKDYDMEPSVEEHLPIPIPPPFPPAQSHGSTSTDFLFRHKMFADSFTTRSTDLGMGNTTGTLVTTQNLSRMIHNTTFPVASPATKRIWRNMKYPFHWSYFKLFGPDQVDETRIKAKYLPIFLEIPIERLTEVLQYVKKHALKLRDGRVIISLEDMRNCGDSRSWYLKEKANMVKNDLKPLEYTSERIEELDEMATTDFGRYLKELWDVGMKQAEESISFKRKVRRLGDSFVQWK